MVGVNVPIPVPTAPFSFGGWKDSLFGDLHVYGREGVLFYTRGKVVTERWPRDSDGSALRVSGQPLTLSGCQRRGGAMTDTTVIANGTVVTAEGEFAGDVLIEGETITRRWEGRRTGRRRP